MNRLCPALALSMLLAGIAHAGTPINQTRSVAADARIDVSNVKGSVTVAAWDRQEVAITGTLGDGVKELLVEGSEHHLVIKVEPPKSGSWFSWGADSRMGPTILDIKAPRGAEMNIEVVSADVTVAGIAGRSLDVDSVSGNVRLDSDAKEVDIDSVSGDVDLRGTSSRAHLETVSGNLRVHGLGGEISMETVSGDIDAEDLAWSGVEAGSVSGDINLRGRPASGARLEVETMSGDVRIEVPAELSARVELSTFSGGIRSDFGSVEEPEHGPGSSLEATIGNGDGTIRAETFSGDIQLRRR